MDPLEQMHGMGPAETGTFQLAHAHSGAQGDGRRVKAAFLDMSDPFPVGVEPTYVPVNAATSGRKYRIQIIEVLDINNVLQPVLQVVPV